MSSKNRFSEPTLFILISLADSTKHGYGIMEDIEETYGNKIGPGTLYGAISRLEDQELIEALPIKDRRKPYRITEKGKVFLEERLKEIEAVTKVGFQRLGLV